MKRKFLNSDDYIKVWIRKSKDRQHNGQKKKDRQHNGQKKKDKRINNELQNIHIRWSNKNATKDMGMNSGSPEG